MDTTEHAYSHKSLRKTFLVAEDLKGAEKAFTMEQSMPLQAEKGSSKERTESELFCLGKRWLGRDGSIQPTDYHIKKSIEEVEEDEIKLCCSK